MVSIEIWVWCLNKESNLNGLVQYLPHLIQIADGGLPHVGHLMTGDLTGTMLLITVTLDAYGRSRRETEA